MNPWMQVTAWTLIHFVWQGGLLALATAAGLRLCRRRSPEARYAIACAGLTAMLALARRHRRVPLGVRFGARGRRSALARPCPDPEATVDAQANPAQMTRHRPRTAAQRW